MMISDARCLPQERRKRWAAKEIEALLGAPVDTAEAGVPSMNEGISGR